VQHSTSGSKGQRDEAVGGNDSRIATKEGAVGVDVAIVVEEHILSAVYCVTLSASNTKTGPVDP
jgi:hypothetical protein